MKSKYVLYLLLWLLIMVVLSSDSFSYYVTRREIKEIFLFFNPNASLRTILKVHEFCRKGLHVLNFGILSWILLCAWVKSTKPISKWTVRTGLICIFFCVLYSVFEEWRQSFSQVRTPRILDIFLDIGGATITQLICALLWLITRRSNASETPAQQG